MSLPLDTVTPDVIDRAYLLVSHIPIYLNDDGQYGTDTLWHKDLVGHFRYIKRFTLAAPVVRGWPTDTRMFTESDRDGASVHFLALPEARSLPQNVVALPTIIARLWRGIGVSDIVHIGVTAGPIPHGWVAGPIARMRKKLLVVIIESSPWRAGKDDSLRKRIRGAINEWFAHKLCNLASVSFYTQNDYKLRYLRDPSKGFINSASWIDEDAILSGEEAHLEWGKKRETEVALRIGLFSRLVSDKGILVLLGAMKRLEQRGVSVHLDVYGTGDLLVACQEVARSGAVSATVRVCGSLPYGPSFFAAIRKYHALVIPSLTEEQPRIVFDSFSQAVPCLASDTSGLRQCINDGVNGRLVEEGNVEKLADLIEWAARNRGELQRMGINSLAAARALTHRQMHRDRCTVLLGEITRFYDRAMGLIPK